VATAPQVNPSAKGIMGSDSAANRRQNHTLPTESIAQIKTDELQRQHTPEETVEQSSPEFRTTP